MSHDESLLKVTAWIDNFRRLRMYIIAVRMDGSVTGDDANAEKFFDQVALLLEAMKTKPFPLERLILPESAPYIVNELSRRQAHRDDTDRRISENEIQRDTRLCHVVVFEGLAQLDCLGSNQSIPQPPLDFIFLCQIGSFNHPLNIIILMISTILQHVWFPCLEGLPPLPPAPVADPCPASWYQCRCIRGFCRRGKGSTGCTRAHKYTKMDILYKIWTMLHVIWKVR